MDKSFHQGNRQKFYDSLENGTIALFFSGHAFRKTADEFFPFYANRNFVYLTGIEKENFVLMAEKQILAQAEQILIDTGAVVPLQVRTGHYLIDDDVTGVNFYFSGYNIDLVYGDCAPTE